MIYIGIDPGVHGGMVSIDVDGIVADNYVDDDFVSVTPMPKTLIDIWDWLYLHCGSSIPISSPPYFSCTEAFAVIERVGGFMGAHKGEEKYVTGANVASAHTMFRFGSNYGALCMALTAAGIPWEDVLPRKWQRALQILPRKKGESKSLFKGRIKTRAQVLYPGVKVTLDIADALCIATYCQYKREGKLG